MQDKEKAMAYVDSSGGTFTGNIGFGGVTPGFVVHVEKSVAGDKLAYFNNTSNSGYGVRFQNGIDTNYAIKVTNAAGTKDTLQAYGDGIVEIGELPSVVTGLSGGLRRDNGLRIYSSSTGNDDASLFLVSNVGGASGQWSSSAHMGYIAQSSDGGIRMLLNRYIQSNSTLSAYESDRPQADLGLDSAGNFSYHYIQPSGLGTGAYSGTGSQTFVIYGGGFGQSPDGAEGIPVDLMTMQGGRYMRFRTCSTTNDPQPVIEFQQDQTIWWYQKMTSPPGTAARAPFRIRHGVAPTSPADGDIWTTTAGLFVRINGSTVGPLS
jgi:hypothetical protein